MSVGRVPPLPALLAILLALAGCRSEEPPGAGPRSPAAEPAAAPARARAEPLAPPTVAEPARSPDPAGPRKVPARPRAVGEPVHPVTARAEASTWTVALEVPGRLRTGDRALGRVRIAAREGMHVNEEYPTAFRPAAGSVAGFGAERVPLADVIERIPCAGGASACEVTFALPFVPEAPGDVRVAGTLAFSVCSAERCLIEKVALEAVTVAR